MKGIKGILAAPLLACILIASLHAWTASPVRAASTALAATDENKPSTWAQADIKAMIAKGIVPKELQGKYKQNITREEYAALAEQVIYYITGAQKQLERIIPEFRFDDSISHSVNRVYSLGIVNGVTDHTFEPTRYIARKEAVVMMGNLLSSMKVEGLSYTKAAYIDYAAIPSWAHEAADVTFNAKIFVGNSAGMEPDKPYTREQSIVTMKRLIDFASNVQGISYRGKIYTKFEDIQDVYVGNNYVKLGSSKSEATVEQIWASVSSNFPSISSLGDSPVQVGEYTIETNGADYKVRISWK
ncbi:S-layer homology domain-containing protein [Paenibacillus xylaniclasticus]|uniref:S-layer homology domain-containing protein n=1 Tax=Paenibacillus xylaniclasticus TaxID=588083 RepID=UPI000FD8FB7C|nr:MULTISPECIES: S-layer homology domain-containing protein [Paenibacillus]GFN33217.1 hypothetical protein PCURB6_34770 [Paenibacillus curdlanolyticus]